MSDELLRRTSLYPIHKQLGARFTPFGGWEMPVQYSGLVDEHNCVRNAVGVFDVSHMGEVLVEGAGAETYLERITCNHPAPLKLGQAQYSMLLNPKGGVVDDIIIYRQAADKFFICVNAGNTEKDFQWMLNEQRGAVTITNLSAEYAQLAIQGPKAEALLEDLAGLSRGACSSAQFPGFYFRDMKLEKIAGAPVCMVARTGYTGEDGFEIYCTPAQAPDVLNAIIELGAAHGVKPAGLGARDTLRLEACYPLHGHEITDDLTPLEAGLGWVVKLDKGEFIGRDALVRQKEQGLEKCLVGLGVIDPGIIREGAKLFSAGAEVGWVTSGTKPPTINKSIALGYLPKNLSSLGTEVEAEVRGRLLKTKVIKKPFYKRSAKA